MWLTRCPCRESKKGQNSSHGVVFTDGLYYKGDTSTHAKRTDLEGG